MADRVLVGTYRKHAIYFGGGERVKRFSTTLEGSERETTSDTYEELLKRIDSYFTRKSKTRKLELPVVDKRAQQWTVTGINLHTEHVTGGPTSTPEDIYPQVDWIVLALEDWMALEARQAAIKEVLKPYLIKGRRADYGEYDQRLTRLEAEYAEKKAKAEERDNER